MVQLGVGGVYLSSLEPAERTLHRIQAEYLEMPGLCLTAAQVQRLVGVEPGRCQAILDALVDAGFLRLTRDSRYVLVT